MVARYQRHIRDVVAADLPNAVGHFEQTMNGVDLTLTPEARIYRGWRRRVSPVEIMARNIPGNAVRRLNDSGRVGGDQPSTGTREIAGVIKGQHCGNSRVAP